MFVWIIVVVSLFVVNMLLTAYIIMFIKTKEALRELDRETNWLEEFMDAYRESVYPRVVNLLTNDDYERNEDDE